MRLTNLPDDVLLKVRNQLGTDKKTLASAAQVDTSFHALYQPKVNALWKDVDVPLDLKNHDGRFGCYHGSSSPTTNNYEVRDPWTVSNERCCI